MVSLNYLLDKKLVKEQKLADGTALPTPTAEELELFGESLRFGQNE